MRRYIFPAVALLAILAAGCNPVGMDETRCFVRGRIYEDTGHTIGAEGITVLLTGTEESYITTTNANGGFFIEIQMYPEMGEEGGNPGGLAGEVTFGAIAIYHELEYEYVGTSGTTFIVTGGDTLSLYDVDLSMFGTK
ncbi:MAG: hypothetical protein R6U39_09220 [Candidatus Aegiribacteria sp.]